MGLTEEFSYQLYCDPTQNINPALGEPTRHSHDLTTSSYFSKATDKKPSFKTGFFIDYRKASLTHQLQNLPRMLSIFSRHD